MERFCTYNISGFADQTYLDCQVTGQYIKIRDVFTSANTTWMTLVNSFEPPTLKFTLPSFLNPRTTGPSDGFDIAIYD